MPESQAAETIVRVGVKQHMRATLITPDGNGPYPGILLLHTSGGLEEADIHFGEELAKQGYVVLLPEFMAAYDITAKTRRLTFTDYAEPIYADFVSAIGSLRRDPKVAGSNVGAIGFSNGGYFAMWLAATDRVQAGVSYYGALSGAGTDRSLKRFASTFNKTSAPVLILHGTDDDTVPIGAAKHLKEIVASAGSPLEIHIYDGAGHRFERDSSEANDKAAADAWHRTIAFFREYLR
jgi:carboxymethylenebutenolidase